MVPRKRPQLGPPAVERDKTLGALPVVAQCCERLDIRGIVDRACPVRDVAILTHGRVIETLIATGDPVPAPEWGARAPLDTNELTVDGC